MELSNFGIIAIAIFIVGYILITLEHKLGTHKSAIALALAGILWVIVAMSGTSREDISHSVEIAGSEVMGIVTFLLAAMTLVEIMTHYRFFDFLRLKLVQLHLKEKQQMMVMGVLTFFLSAVLDNLTITIVMIQIARQFFKDKNLVIAAATIVVLANAGGAWSPIGDVTTILLWLAHKFEAMTIIKLGFIPAVVIGLVSGSLLIRQMQEESGSIKVKDVIVLTPGEKVVIGSILLSFTLPIIMNLIGLPPYMGLLLGLGFVWTLVELIKRRSTTPTHLEARIESLLQKTDIASLKFFIGILLAVSALQTLGVLEYLSEIVFTSNPSFTRVVIGNIGMGLFSSIVDNVPLTALAIDILKVTDQRLWVLTALAVGTGGSCLVIGSAAGVVAMGMVKELTFHRYFKIAFFPALLGYIAGMATWLIQYKIL